MIIVVIIIEPGFLHPSNFIKILTQASTRGILALGVAGMIVLAGTDLSQDVSLDVVLLYQLLLYRQQHMLPECIRRLQKIFR